MIWGRSIAGSVTFEVASAVVTKRRPFGERVGPFLEPGQEFAEHLRTHVTVCRCARSLLFTDSVQRELNKFHYTMLNVSVQWGYGRVIGTSTSAVFFVQ